MVDGSRRSQGCEARLRSNRAEGGNGAAANGRRGQASSRSPARRTWPTRSPRCRASSSFRAGPRPGTAPAVLGERAGHDEVVPESAAGRAAVGHPGHRRTAVREWAARAVVW